LTVQRGTSKGVIYQNSSIFKLMQSSIPEVRVGQQVLVRAFKEFSWESVIVDCVEGDCFWFKAPEWFASEVVKKTEYGIYWKLNKACLHIPTPKQSLLGVEDKKERYERS
jgi:hypothetical protein